MKAISTIIKYIGFPMLIFGILLGGFATYHSMVFFPLLVNVTEVCHGNDCKVIDDMKLQLDAEKNASINSMNNLDIQTKEYIKTLQEKDLEIHKMYDIYEWLIPDTIYCRLKNDTSIYFTYEVREKQPIILSLNGYSIDADKCAVCRNPNEELYVDCVDNSDNWYPKTAELGIQCQRCNAKSFFNNIEYNCTLYRIYSINTTKKDELIEFKKYKTTKIDMTKYPLDGKIVLLKKLFDIGCTAYEVK